MNKQECGIKIESDGNHTWKMCDKSIRCPVRGLVTNTLSRSDIITASLPITREKTAAVNEKAFESSVVKIKSFCSGVEITADIPTTISDPKERVNI